MGIPSSTLPTLETARLRLRQLTLADAPWYLMHFSRPEIVHGHGMPAPAGIETAEVEIRALEHPDDPFASLRWGIEDLATGELIGTAGLHRLVELPRREADIGYDLEPSAWGHGYMAEAIGALLRYAFTELRLECIWATVLEGNERSLRVLESAGFRRLGLRSGSDPDEHGVFRDEWRLYFDRPADSIA
jgi:[ribosomal protein S5]-alanine N-acetyltransferase